MNKYVFKISDFIINSDIKNININYINNINYDMIQSYGSIDELYSFATKIRIFQKLVLYNYCYNFYIGDLSDNELININNFISIENTKLNLNIDYKYMQFFYWCKVYNRQNKNKVKVVSLKHKHNIVFYLDDM